MKYVVVALACCGGAGWSATASPPPPPDLRQLLQQLPPAGTSAQPRQLTPLERAELRRQLGAQGESPQRRRTLTRTAEQ